MRAGQPRLPPLLPLTIPGAPLANPCGIVGPLHVSATAIETSPPLR